MQLTVVITLSETEAHNPENSFECRVIDTLTNKSIGGFVWVGSSSSNKTIGFNESGDFVNELIEIEIEITSEIAFDYSIDVEVT